MRLPVRVACDFADPCLRFQPVLGKRPASPALAPKLGLELVRARTNSEDWQCVKRINFASSYGAV